MRVLDSFMKARVSSSRLAGRTGRTGGGPGRSTNGTVLACSRTGGLDTWVVSWGREMQRLRSLGLGRDDRVPRRLRKVEVWLMVGRRGGIGWKMSTGIWGRGGGGGGECVGLLFLLPLKRREPKGDIRLEDLEDTEYIINVLLLLRAAKLEHDLSFAASRPLPVCF